VRTGSASTTRISTASRNRDFADNPDIRRNFTGRVLRINKDGSIPKDNPWLARATVPANTFAHGLKDPEGATLNPQTGELWAIDHGPQGGDEINIIRAERTTAGRR
jgi:glucose/arabinose dehydrogenase